VCVKPAVSSSSNNFHLKQQAAAAAALFCFPFSTAFTLTRAVTATLSVGRGVAVSVRERKNAIHESFIATTYHQQVVFNQSGTVSISSGTKIQPRGLVGAPAHSCSCPQMVYTVQHTASVDYYIATLCRPVAGAAPPLLHQVWAINRLRFVCSSLRNCFAKRACSKSA
jgi:hypothetical protein